MKKSLIALAAVAASGAAFAQSSVTVFGIVDAAVTVYDGKDTVSGLGNSGNSSSRLGFRGVEDLGNGLKAQFWLEGAVSNDDGSGAGGGAEGPGFEFKRRSTISLLSNYGELRMGRSTTAAYDAVSRYDNFGAVGVGATRVWSTGGYDLRRSNMLGYYSSDFSGFKFALNYAFGEQTSGGRDGSYVGGSATYDNGPLSVGFGAEQFRRGTVAGEDITAYGLGASYNFGVVKLAGAYLNQENEAIAGTKVDRDHFLLALSAPVGAAGEAKLSYNRYNQDVAGGTDLKADQFSLGYVHNLSKRTAVYGTYAYLKNKNNGAAFTLGGAGLDKPAVDAGGKIQAFQVGVRHAF
ncbi:porin [Comamonas aquatica]|uniref:porin n=1 Tax=Comamonas aquatica TaxID=225991 RepID=UPI00244BB863|nr:porin [Comamonas aquatica]MDH0493997.1 porin [Comamonas aquatica]